MPKTLCLILLLLFAAGCERRKISETVPPELSEQEIWNYAEKSVSFGDRHSGSEAIRRYSEWIRTTAAGFSKCKVSIHAFTEKTPRGTIEFRNIIAEIPGKSDSFILIGAHYDTKRFSFIRGFQGANDGASGVAALLGMIAALQRQKEKPPCTFRFVFFDGEECLEAYGPDDGLHGSRRLAQEWEDSGELKRCRAMILMDMIGDRDLTLTIPKGCTADLVRRFLRTARKNGHGDKCRVYEHDMIDDHVPFLKRGVPAISLIDFEYGPGNAFWHTAQDSLDKISAQSIRTAADLAFALCMEIAQ